MLGMPVNVQDSQLADDLVAAKHLNGHDRGIFHKVADNLAVEDLQ